MRILVASAVLAACAATPAAATAKGLKAQIIQQLGTLRPVPARTMNSQKFKEFMTNARNDKTLLLPTSKPGYSLVAHVGQKMYPGKFFIENAKGPAAGVFWAVGKLK
jgi:hypothetical protein